MSSKRSETRPRPTTLAENAARAYRALNRLIEGRATHPSHAGRSVRITPATVAREARRSRNPLYTTHRDIRDEIAAAAHGPTIATDLGEAVAQLESEIAALRATVRRYEARSVCWRLKTWLCCTAPAQLKKKLRHMRSPHIQSVRCNFVSMSVPEMLGAILPRQKSHSERLLRHRYVTRKTGHLQRDL